MRREQKLTLFGRYEITIGEPPRFTLDNGIGRVFVAWRNPTVIWETDTVGNSPLLIGKIKRQRGWIGVWTRNGFGTVSVSDAVWESRKSSLLVEAGMVVDPNWSVWN